MAKVINFEDFQKNVDLETIRYVCSTYLRPEMNIFYYGIASEEDDSLLLMACQNLVNKLIDIDSKTDSELEFSVTLELSYKKYCQTGKKIWMVECIRLIYDYYTQFFRNIRKKTLSDYVELEVIKTILRNIAISLAALLFKEG